MVNEHRKKLVTRILEGDGRATAGQRKAAFENHDVAQPARALIEKVTKHAYKISDDDVAAAKAGGLSEDEIFELSVCAAIGQATRQIDNALAALDEATKETK